MSNIGMRVYSNINRPTKEAVNEFKGLPVSVIADNMNRMFCMNPKIRPINDKPLLGPAFTIKTRPGDNLMLHKALDLAQPGDILVVDAQGDLTNAIMGELMVLWAQKRGLGGFIIDGAIRDVGALRKMDIPIYAAGVNPRGPYKDGPGEINVPISCGGVVVHPGDIVVGDDDGIVVINPQDTDELIEKAKAKFLREHQEMNDIMNMTWDRTWVDKSLQDRGCEIKNKSSKVKELITGNRD
jgi:RraA family protein